MKRNEIISESGTRPEGEEEPAPAGAREKEEGRKEGEERKR